VEDGGLIAAKHQTVSVLEEEVAAVLPTADWEPLDRAMVEVAMQRVTGPVAAGAVLDPTAEILQAARALQSVETVVQG